ncbi:MAG: hypothetical protein Ct9H90mP6_08610 [Gammaproteobacteria bacterium]|nr:MAG: hypothetical protein Ct9H90mP6_08610 [Gammaproteobacteria bacterium]
MPNYNDWGKKLLNDLRRLGKCLMTESGRCQCGEIHYSFERDKIISGHHFSL